MIRFPRQPRPATRTEVLRQAARAIRAHNARQLQPALAEQPHAELLRAGFTLREISLGAGK